MHWSIILIVLLSLVGVAVFFMRRAYQILFLRRLDLVTGWNGKPLREPARVASDMGLVKLATGIAFVFLPIAFILVQVPFKKWYIGIGLMAVLCAGLFHFVVSRHQKSLGQVVKVEEAVKKERAGDFFE